MMHRPLRRFNAWRPLWRALVWRPLRQFPARALVSLLAVALGIAVVIGIRLASRAATQSFAVTSHALAGSADLLVRGPVPISATTLAQLNVLGGQARILPYINRMAYDPRGRDSLELYGASLLALPSSARAASSPAVTAALRRAAARPAPAPVLLAATYARQHGYHEGQSLTLIVGSRRVHLRIAALLPDRGLARAQAGHIAVLDVGVLAELLNPGVPPSFDGLNIRLAPGVSAETLIRQLRPLIPAGDSVQPPAARQHQADKMLAAFQANLLALSFVALLVGAFLIYQTMTMAVLRRRTSIAVVRALGAPALAVRTVLLAEAAAVATLGALVGLGLGWLFARLTVQELSATVNNLYAVNHPQPLRLTPADLLLALSLAWGVAVISAWGPVRQAARVAPASALRPEEPELEFRLRSRHWLAACAGFAAVALVAAWLPSPFGLPLNGYVSAFAAVLAAALAVPLLLRWVLPPARRWLAGHRRPRLALAAASLLASQRRAAIVIAALATAIAMVVGIAAMVASFRATVNVWLGETLQAQVYVRPLAWSRRHPASIPPALVRLALATPGVRGAAFYFSAPFVFHHQTALLATRWSPDQTPQQALTARLRFLQAPRPAPRARLVYVSEPFARHFGLWRGASLRLDTRMGWRTARIAGVFYDYSSSQGILRLDVATYRRWFGSPPVTDIALTAQPGVAPALLRRRVARRLARAGGAFSVHDQAALKQQALGVFDQTFRITGALELVALLVAILGVANTLWAVVLERRRELAVLRFLGATPGQVRGVLLGEAAWIGVLSVILGAALGAALAAILIYVVNVESFGWTIQVHPPWAYLVAALALVFAATLAAGWLPARWAAHADPLRAVAAE